MLKLARPVTYLEQRGDSDCAVTCLAMAFGLNWEEIIERIGDLYDKDGVGDYGGCLLRLGLKKDDFMSVEAYECLGQDWFNKGFWGRPALLTVPSRRIKAGLHAIYYDGHKVLDPAPEKWRYKKFEGLPVLDYVVFRDGL